MAILYSGNKLFLVLSLKPCIYTVPINQEHSGELHSWSLCQQHWYCRPHHIYSCLQAGELLPICTLKRLNMWMCCSLWANTEINRRVRFLNLLHIMRLHPWIRIKFRLTLLCPRNLAWIQQLLWFLHQTKPQQVLVQTSLCFPALPLSSWSE